MNFEDTRRPLARGDGGCLVGVLVDVGVDPSLRAP